MQKMNALRLSKGEDPAKLFEKLKAINNQFSDLAHALTKDNKIASILERGSDKYGDILANTARKKGSSLTVEHLKEAMKMQWQIVQGSNTSSGTENKEFSLVGFNGTCYHCGERGHQANKCLKKQSRGNQQSNNQNEGSRPKFTGKCQICEKVGHKAAQCWNNKSNKEKGQIGGKQMEKQEQQRQRLDQV